MVYDHIPECKCATPDFCARHDVFTEAEINYIRIALGNMAIVDAAQEVPVGD